MRSQPLCIVVDLGANATSTGTSIGTSKVFLPFAEDGGTLSVILSKAFPLAADDQVHSTILTHLRRR